MDNQHKKISGYRDLSQEEIDLMNDVKAHAEETRHLISRIEQVLLTQEDNHTNTTSPMRWLAEGRTDLQKGYMCLVRSVAQPTTF
jgi:ferritin-like metal-binding protein YciE